MEIHPSPLHHAAQSTVFAPPTLRALARAHALVLARGPALDLVLSLFAIPVVAIMSAAAEMVGDDDEDDPSN